MDGRDEVEVTAAHEARVGAITVRRALPRAARRTIGAWCFADHMGPLVVNEHEGLDVGPHPHMGLQTVTWLRSGAVLHRDSLGSQQVIQPGQLNLMTAGHGVSHAEERTGHYSGPLEGIQLWIAQPEASRHGAASFQHLDSLPVLDLGGATATVLVGSLLGAASPALVATPIVGADLAVHARTTLPLDPGFEHGVVVLAGAVHIDGSLLTPGHLGYLTVGHDELLLQPVAGDPVQLVLLGGEPFPEPIRMWWNFVGRERDEFVSAHRSWVDDDGRFGTVASDLPRILTTPPTQEPTR
jgi:hypothetical protein